MCKEFQLLYATPHIIIIYGTGGCLFIVDNALQLDLFIIIRK